MCEYEFEEEYNNLPEGETDLSLEDYDFERRVEEYGMTDEEQDSGDD